MIDNTKYEDLLPINQSLNELGANVMDVIKEALNPVLENVKLQRDQAIAECYRLQAVQRAIKMAIEDWLDYLSTHHREAFEALTKDDQDVLWRLVSDAKTPR